MHVRVDANGRATYYGSWRVGGRRVKRRLGPKRRSGSKVTPSAIRCDGLH